MDFSIETPRLLLRPFSLEDTKAYFQMTRDPDIQQYIPGACPDTLEETRHNIKTYYTKCDFKNDFYLLIEEKASQQIVGFIEITLEPRGKDFDCCYFIHKLHRRKGYLKEILPAFLEKVYSPGMEIYFSIESSNTPSLTFIRQMDNVFEIANSTYYVFLYQGK